MPDTLLCHIAATSLTNVNHPGEERHYRHCGCHNHESLDLFLTHSTFCGLRANLLLLHDPPRIVHRLFKFTRQLSLPLVHLPLTGKQSLIERLILLSHSVCLILIDEHLTVLS